MALVLPSATPFSTIFRPVSGLVTPNDLDRHLPTPLSEAVASRRSFRSHTVAGAAPASHRLPVHLKQATEHIAIHEICQTVFCHGMT